MNEPRYGVTSYYSGPLFRNLSDWILGTKQHVLDSTSPELLQLLGFKPFGSYGQTGELDATMAKAARHLVGEIIPR